ncbi:MAG: ribonuclease P protein component [Planctomycetes bacterium]|nr:ribonuclease P protein component [Planctomycetota bacterium]
MSLMPDQNSERFPKSNRLCRQRDFDRTFKSGRVIADSVLVVHATANQLDRWRLGISISRKVGNAVVRNRWKRWIREAFRRQTKSSNPCFDLVIRPRKGAHGDFDSTCKSLTSCIKRLSKH